MTRNRMCRRAAALTVAATLLAVIPAGAARGAGGHDPERIAKSGDALARSGSVKYRGTASGGSSQGGGKVTFDGTFDFKQRAGDYKVDVAAIGLPGTGKTRVLLVNGVSYFSLDALQGLGTSSSTPGLEGKKWLKLDPDVLSSIFGGTTFGQSNPDASLDALRGVTDAKKVGSEQVRGTSTTHSRVHIDLDKAVTGAPDALRDEVRTSVGALGSGTIPADVWIDGKGRLRRIRLSIGGGSNGTKGSIAFEFFALGGHSSVQAPPASEVVDITALLGGTSPVTRARPPGLPRLDRTKPGK